MNCNDDEDQDSFTTVSVCDQNLLASIVFELINFTYPEKLISLYFNFSTLITKNYVSYTLNLLKLWRRY